jgi:hypothetical protein
VPKALLEHTDLALEQVSWLLASLRRSFEARLQEQLEAQRLLEVALAYLWP